MEESIAGIIIEHDIKKLQGLAIQVDKILREEIKCVNLQYKFIEARIYNIKTVGVQGDGRSYYYPAEITIKEPKHLDGKPYNDEELHSFLATLSTRITNEIKEINRVLYVTGTKT